MKDTDKWISINESLPGIGKMVLVFDEETNLVDGPVRIDEMGSSVSNSFKDLAWITTSLVGLRQGGVRFTKFEPTHWLPIPSPPPSKVSE